MTRLEIKDIMDQMVGIEGFDPGPLPEVGASVLLDAYKGCGPDCWPADIRDRLDEATVEYAPSVLVHDVEFYLSDGSFEGMHKANERFHRNNKAIFSQNYPLVSLRIFCPSYRLKRVKAKSIMAALNLATSDAFTKRAWDVAHKAKLERLKEWQAPR